MGNKKALTMDMKVGGRYLLRWADDGASVLETFFIKLKQRIPSP